METIEETKDLNKTKVGGFYLHLLAKANYDSDY